MQKKNKGFTLIEILVVIVIIAVLAAIGLPHYRVIIFKSHLTRLMPIVHSVYGAQQHYYMVHGTYADSFDELVVSFPDVSKCAKINSVKYRCDKDVFMFADKNFVNNKYYPDVQVQYWISGKDDGSKLAYLEVLEDFTHQSGFTLKKGKRYCLAGRKGDQRLVSKVCESLGGILKQEDSQSSGWKRYELP